MQNDAEAVARQNAQEQLKKKKMMIIAGAAFILVVLFIFMNSSQINPNWTAYIYSSKNSNIMPMKINGSFPTELECRDAAEQSIKTQVRLDESGEIADAFLCGKACRSSALFGTPSITQIICEKSYLSLLHGG